jgi:cellulose synthase/poly-beta-1,6-N-acetylglucosamine synthase-like glycosyltransferase
MGWISLLIFIAVPLTAASLIVLIEISAAMLSKRRTLTTSIAQERPSVVVLIPAHDESRGILPTLEDVRRQLRPGDRLLVVADNCTDDTAAVAEMAGAQVIARQNDTERGKGYALDFGLRSLREDDPKIVVILDADCRLEPGVIDQLAQTCSATGRPVQALYLMSAPDQTGLNHAIAEFAWRIKNDLRPRGLAALGLPCQLMGSGMAFPRRAFAAVKVASGHLAEDLDLGLQLARAGCAPLFCPGAVVRSVFPAREADVATQRQRWEHGHLSVLVGRVLPSVWAAVRDRNWRLLALGLDAGVPPLVLLAGLTTTAVCLASLLGWLAGAGKAALIVSSIGLGLLGVALGLAWLACGRDLLTGPALWSLAPYLKMKAGIYARAFAANKKWTRTGRGEAP